MVIKVNKNTTAEEINIFIKNLQKLKRKNLKNFYGKLKGSFGDAMEYQRNER